MSTVLVTLTDFVIDDTPATLSISPSRTTSPATTTAQNTPTSNSSSQPIIELSPTPTVTIIPKPTLLPAIKAGDHTIIVLSLACLLVLAVTGAGILGFLIWRFRNGYCPGCSQRDQRIKFLEKEDPVSVSNHETNPSNREFTMYDEGGRQERGENSNIPSNTTEWPRVSNPPPTSGVAPVRPVLMHQPASRWSETTLTPQPIRSIAGSIHCLVRGAPQTNRQARVEEEADALAREASYDSQKTNSIYGYYHNGYQNPYAPASQSSIVSYNRQDQQPEHEDTNTFDGNQPINQPDPYHYPGLQTPPWEHVARPPPKPPGEPQKTEQDLAQEENERADRVRQHRRTGGYGGFDDVDLSSPTKAPKGNWI